MLSIFKYGFVTWFVWPPLVVCKIFYLYQYNIDICFQRVWVHYKVDDAWISAYVVHMQVQNKLYNDQTRHE